MSEYDSWAPIYDAWASDMTEDVAHYVELAREADGPIVELRSGPAGSRSRSRARPESACSGSTRRPRCSRSRASAPPGCRSSCALGDVRDFDARGAGGAHLCARSARSSTCRRLAGEAQRLRARRALAPAGRALRVQRVRVQPHRRGAQLDGQKRIDARRRSCHTITLRRRPTTGSTSTRGRGDARRCRSSGGRRSPSGTACIDVAGLEVEALYGWFDAAAVRTTSSHEIVWVARKPA